MPADVWDGTTCDVLERARLAAMSLSLLCVISVGGGGRPPAGVRRGTAPGPASMYAVDKFEVDHSAFFALSALAIARRGRTDDRRACRGCGYSFNNASFHRSTQVSTALWAPRRHTYPGLRSFDLPIGRSRLRPRRTRLALGSLLSVPGPFLFSTVSIRSQSTSTSTS